MRTIQVSPDVFQAIWAGRKPGEDDEDAILRRLLKAGPARPSDDVSSPAVQGFIDPSYGVHFPEGFEVFRTYLGRDYRARVVNGHWVIDGTATRASSINQLSSAIGIQTENGWANWEYRAPNGEVKKIGALRDPARIRRRRRAQL